MAEAIPSIRIGHLQIVDHLILGMSTIRLKKDKSLLDDLYPEPVPMTSWEQICHGLEKAHLGGAFLPIPLAMDLFASGLNIKLLMLVHRSGSQIVVRRDIQTLKDLKGTSMLVPSLYSIQSVLLHQFLASVGLTYAPAHIRDGDVVQEAAPPALMPEMMGQDQDGDIGGYAVSAPFAQMAAAAGDGRLLCPTHSLWKHHPCCAFVVKGELLDQYPGIIQSLVSHFMASARDIGTAGTDTLTRCAADFLHQDLTLAAQALSGSRVSFKPETLVPDTRELDALQTYMIREMGLMEAPLPLDQFLDTSCAEKALAENAIETRA